ncbi:hypothetical protein [Nocardia sp. BMG51109]|uniref:hypothetical protein n=1 Tax=Nocardia sp. BMG51109 TaxID=1056816 RepID=UPI0018DD9B99|nr:hypothetical protein [Nocardia sp. BMG51109]
MRHTEIEGLRATWRLDRRQIEILEVHNLSRDAETGAEVTFEPGTDLAEARVRRPEWEPLWNAIRREFWLACTRRPGDRPTPR